MRVCACYVGLCCLCVCVFMCLFVQVFLCCRTITPHRHKTRRSGVWSHRRHRIARLHYRYTYNGSEAHAIKADALPALGVAKRKLALTALSGCSAAPPAFAIVGLTAAAHEVPKKYTQRDADSQTDTRARGYEYSPRHHNVSTSAS